jgi:hypothetical protein
MAIVLNAPTDPVQALTDALSGYYAQRQANALQAQATQQQLADLALRRQQEAAYERGQAADQAAQTLAGKQNAARLALEQRAAGVTSGGTPFQLPRGAVPSQIVPRNRGAQPNMNDPRILYLYATHYTNVAAAYAKAGYGDSPQAQNALATARMYAASADKITEQQQTTARDLLLRRTPQAKAPGTGRGRGRTSSGGVDADTLAQVDTALQNSPDPVATADAIISRAIAAGANTRTIEAIRARGQYWADKRADAGKRPPRSAGASPFPSLPQP